jgi:adenylyltransferase/sulfurtransferase
MEFRTFKVRRDPQCPVCGENPTITAPIDYEQFCGVPILDPKSLEETRQEVHNAKTGGNGQAKAKPDPSLDAKGLPPGYRFDPEWEVTPREVKAMQDRGEKLVLIDVREPNEWAITHIVGQERLIPRGQWAQAPAKLAGHENDRVVVHCRSGARSLQVAQFLRQNGFEDVKSMAGGILLWNKDVNPGGPQY